MESFLRRKLAQIPALKLFIKIFLDLLKCDFYQSKNSFNGCFATLKCEIQRLIKNQKSVKCNICYWQGNKFFPHVNSARVTLEQKCPQCHSIPRYRTLMKFLSDDIDFFNNKLSVLEIGPNRCLQNRLLKHSNFDYISIDLKSSQAMMHMNVTDLKFEDNRFDLIFCISVMQYVDDDVKGFGELYRVLKHGGRLIFASGIDEKSNKTIEYSKRLVKNCFTTRLYGRDVVKKMENEGFKVKEYRPYNSCSEFDKKRFGLSNTTIFLLEK